MRSAFVLGALLLASLPAAAESPKPCTILESKVEVEPGVARKGTVPEFVLELTNRGQEGVRLLDVRKGRRRDLAYTYYELVVRHESGAAIEAPRMIGDPGPISEEDFFVLAPGSTISLPVRSLRKLEELSPGSYLAHVSLWMDPYSAGSRCRSEEARFRVR